MERTGCKFTAASAQPLSSARFRTLCPMRSASPQRQGSSMVEEAASPGRLARAVELATAELDYSDENYAYGSTPYTSYITVRTAVHRI